MMNKWESHETAQEDISPSKGAINKKGQEKISITLITTRMNRKKVRYLNATVLGVSIDIKDNLLREEAALIDFISNHKSLVYPNILKMVEKKDSEGIRMALNYIHYGSLKDTTSFKFPPIVEPLPGTEKKDMTGYAPIINDNRTYQLPKQHEGENNDCPINENLDDPDGINHEIQPGANKDFIASSTSREEDSCVNPLIPALFTLNPFKHLSH
ncbi:hypothetical protein AgCh_038681 [Apium graveolens]